MSARSASWLAPGLAIAAAGLILAACGPAVDANGEEPQAIVVAAAEGIPEPTSMRTLGGYLSGRPTNRAVGFACTFYPSVLLLIAAAAFAVAGAG